MRRLLSALLVVALAFVSAGFNSKTSGARMSAATPQNPYLCLFCISLDTADHPIATWPSETGRCVIAAGGQSNSAQYYDGIYTPTHSSSQFEFLAYDGSLREFVEPIFGPNGNTDRGTWSAATTYASGDQVLYNDAYWRASATSLNVVPGTDYTKWSGALVGSLWGKLGDSLIDNGLCTTVVWIPFGIGGTEIAEWDYTGLYGPNAIAIVNWMNKLSVNISAFLWMQGERDAKIQTSQVNYFTRASQLIQMTRTAGYTGPWYIAKETFYADFGNSGTTWAPVQDAQQQLWTTLSNVKQGPYFDDMGTSYRYGLNGVVGVGDWTHFNGQNAPPELASRWISALQAGGFAP